jgi:hypothetical protein
MMEARGSREVMLDPESAGDAEKGTFEEERDVNPM